MEYKNVYFLGIGGIGMSALARYFLHEGTPGRRLRPHAARTSPENSKPRARRSTTRTTCG